MKEIVNEIVKAVPKLVEHTGVSLTLSGGSAAVAVGSICVSIVAIYGIYRWANLEERKQNNMELQNKGQVALEASNTAVKVEQLVDNAEANCIMAPVQHASA